MAATPSSQRQSSPDVPDVDFSGGAAFIKGDYVPISEAKISVLD